MKPARYDDLLTITTKLSKKPLVKIEFDFEVRNEKDELLTTGYTSLVFMDMKKNKPIKAPAYLLEQIYSQFNETIFASRHLKSLKIFKIPAALFFRTAISNKQFNSIF